MLLVATSHFQFVGSRQRSTQQMSLVAYLIFATHMVNIQIAHFYAPLFHAMGPKRVSTLTPPVSQTSSHPSRSRTLAIPQQKAAPASSSKSRTCRLDKPPAAAQLLKPLSIERVQLEHVAERMETSRQKRRLSESEDSTSSSEEQVSHSRQQMLARRSRKRLKKYVDEMMQSEPQGLSLLERKAITAKTEQYYNQEYGELKAFISGRRLTFSTAPQKDVGINAYFNHLFLEGHPAHKGEKILASFMHQNPDFSRYGSQKLPRTYRALKGWRRLSPGTSRKAWPLAVWCAVVSAMKRLGQLQMALFTMLGLSSYSRPSELLRCRVFSLVRPAPSVTEHWCLLLNPEEHPARSKTGIRRLSCPRLSLSQALGSTAYASTDQPAEQPDAVGFRLWPVCQSLWPNCQTNGHRHHPLSASALRSK